MSDRHRDVALFRYSLVRELTDPALSKTERGLLIRALADRDHVGPDGKRVRVSRASLDRWRGAWRNGGFDALVPSRKRSTVPLTSPEVLDLALRLKREAPGRTGAQVRAILVADRGWSPSERTIQRLFAREGLNVRPDGATPAPYGRFEAEAPNDRWTGDALHGPHIDGRKAYLFAFIDDHSRAIPGYRWGYSEDTIRLEAALRHGLAARGIPDQCYVDNGSAFVSKQLMRALASLGVRLVHSKPGRPQGRGKIERFFRTVRDQFLVEIEHRGVADIVELNRLFAAWVETVYHRNTHSETGQTPIDRYSTAMPFKLPTPAQLHEAFLWSEYRTVTKTATVSLHGNIFEVDPALIGRKAELVFDPFDLTVIEIRYEGRPMGTGVPHVVRRHTHPQARPDTAPPPVPTGIDYLGLIAARHANELAVRIDYTAITGINGQLAEQLAFPETGA